MAILVDTGILYALADEDDGWHDRARRWLRHVDDLLVVPVTVLPEIACLLQERLGAAAERRFVASVVAGDLEVELLKVPDLARALDLMADYPELGFVDLTIVAIAERLRIRTLATTDRLHFGRVRPRHRTSFDLVP